LRFVAVSSRPISRVIPGRAEGADPESRHLRGASVWIPGSLATLAPGMTGHVGSPSKLRLAHLFSTGDAAYRPTPATKLRYAQALAGAQDPSGAARVQSRQGTGFQRFTR
jgi:hypothetical protein